MKKFKYSYDNKRYHTFNYYLKEKYHHKVSKISLNADFTCPNRDGKVSYGGCIFCSDSGSGDFAGNPSLSLNQQFEDIREMINKKWPGCKYIAYFQANTNTYASVDVLKSKFEPFIGKENVVGLSIATRPDCLEDDVVAYLADLNTRCDLWVELGLQTIHDKTAKIINRGYQFETFLQGLAKLRKHNIHVCVHIINGLPGETLDDMLETAKKLSTLDIQGLKIHILYILKDTPLDKMFQQGLLKPINKEYYIQLVVDQLEYIPEDVVIQRLTGDADANELVEPLWTIKKVSVLNDIDKEFARRDSYQGIKYKKKST